MASKQIAIVYTALVPVAGTVKLVQELMPDVRIVNMVDDSLLADVLAAGELTIDVTRRLCAYYQAAEDGGADLIFNQCSSVSEAVDVGRKLVHTPILKIDEAMAEEAVRRGPRIAVVATLPTTLAPTSRLIERTAQSMGSSIQIQRLLAEGAFEVLSSGDVAGHNAMVMEKILAVQDEVDIVVLAQGSMSVLVPELEAAGLPALTSPRLGFERAKQMLYGD